MATTTDTTELVPLTLAALRLRLGYYVVRDLVLRGELAGRKVGKWWYVEPDSLHAYDARRTNG